MAEITNLNSGSLKEIMDNKLVDLKAQARYLTAKLGNGSQLNVVMANRRGFRIAIDYTRNNTIGYMDPDGGNLTTTLKPPLDNMTANLQYVQFGQEITNLQIANSAAGMKVGPTAKAIAARKLLQRRAEMEEFYFCRSAGFQDIAIVYGAQDASCTNITTGGTGVIVTCPGTTDGLGAYLLGTGQIVRIYDATRATLKAYGPITRKQSNTAFTMTTTFVASSGVTDIISTDVVLPESDSTTPTTTGVKGLPYLVKDSGRYFDKYLTGATSGLYNVSALKAVIDSTTTTFNRTSMEGLYRNSQTRMGANPKQRCATGLAQFSNYYAQFYAQNTAQVHVIGGERPKIDVGADGTPDDYTFWGQPIDAYAMLHPANWWMLDYGTFSRLTLKQAGQMLTQPGEYVLKVSGGAYANAVQGWDDDYLEYLSDEPYRNAGFTALAFDSLPGLLVNSAYTGSVDLVP